MPHFATHRLEDLEVVEDAGALVEVVLHLEVGEAGVQFNRHFKDSLNRRPIRRLPKRVLNLVLNPSLNPSLKF